MLDADITALLTYWRTQTGLTAERAARDLRLLAAEIDAQRQVASQLADQSERLRILAEGRRELLEHIQKFANQAGPLCSETKDVRFALGTIRNMVQQCFDTEKS